VLAVVVLLVGWPSLRYTPTAVLDDGYSYALSRWLMGAFHDRLILFTYGPLASFNEVKAWDRALFGAQLLVAAAILGCFAYLLVDRLRHVLSWPLATVVTWFTVLTGINDGLVEPAVLISLLLLVRTWDGRTSSRRAYWLMLVPIPFLFLAKPSSAVLTLVVLASLGSTTGASMVQRLRQAAVGIAYLTLATVALWLAIGVPIGQLPTSLRGSWEFTVGYDVMSVESAGGLQYSIALVLIIFVLALTALRPEHRLASFITALAVLFVTLKHGFVRHDGHELIFFTTTIVVLAAFWEPSWPRRRSPVFREALLGASLMVVGAILAGVAIIRANHGSVPALHDPLLSTRALARQVMLVADDTRWSSQVEAERKDERAVYGVDATIISRIGRSTVDIQPVDGVLARAYGLNYAPMPVLQDYAGYTGWLDRTTADSLDAPTAAQFILREVPLYAIDERFPAEDAGAYQLQVACRYREVLRTASWQLLEKTEHTCGTPRSVGSVTVGVGQRVPIPAHSESSMIIAKVHVDLGIRFKLQTLLLKPAQIPQIVLDGQPYRYVWTSPDNPILLRVPDNVPAPIAKGATHLDVSDIALRHVRGPVRIAFFEVPLN